jgi:monoamine oxidase
VTRSIIGILARRFGDAHDAATRREFLRGALAASAAAWAGCASTKENQEKDAQRIVVIGAGLAGLAAADACARAGCNVRVLEARSRVGGRVLSRPDLVSGGVVECGGEFIGTNHPTWIQLAGRFELGLHEVTGDDATSIFFDGKILAEPDAKELWHGLEPVLEQLNQLARAIDATIPWTSPNATELDRRALQDWIDGCGAPLKVRGLLATQLAGDNGADPAHQSFLANLAMIQGGGLAKYWTESETHSCDGGAQRLAEALANSLRSALGAESLRLNTPVAEIDDSGGSVRIVTSAGEALEADAVILAIPPSVWQRVRCTPALPADLTPQMGSAIKYIHTLKTPVWEALDRGPNAVSNGAFNYVWNSIAGQPNVNDACLTAFAGGSRAEKCSQLWQMRGGSALDAELERIFPGIGAARTSATFFDWPDNKWTRGGYSFPAPGELTTLGPRLARGHGRIQFAGEHMCPAFIGYMEGALQSGIAAANRVTARLAFR